MAQTSDSAPTSELTSTLLLNCRLWMSEDCRDIQIEYQALDSITKQPVGDVRATKLNRAFIRWQEGPDAFFVGGKGFKPLGKGDELYEADYYVPISDEMLLLAIAQWILHIELSDIQQVIVEEIQCNAAAWVRLNPKRLSNALKSLRKNANGPEVSLQLLRVIYDVNIEKFLD